MFLKTKNYFVVRPLLRQTLHVFLLAGEVPQQFLIKNQIACLRFYTFIFTYLITSLFIYLHMCSIYVCVCVLIQNQSSTKFNQQIYQFSIYFP